MWELCQYSDHQILNHTLWKCEDQTTDSTHTQVRLRYIRGRYIDLHSFHRDYIPNLTWNQVFMPNCNVCYGDLGFCFCPCREVESPQCEYNEYKHTSLWEWLLHASSLVCLFRTMCLWCSDFYQFLNDRNVQKQQLLHTDDDKTVSMQPRTETRLCWISCGLKTKYWSANNKNHHIHTSWLYEPCITGYVMVYPSVIPTSWPRVKFSRKLRCCDVATTSQQLIANCLLLLRW